MVAPSTPHLTDRRSYPAAARVSSLRSVTRTQKKWCVILGILFTFDLVDINSFSYAAPAIKSEWGLSLSSISHVTSAGFLGMFVGGVFGGRISDRIGRKTTIVAAVSCYSIFSLLTLVAHNTDTLMVMRFFTGVGIQATTGVLIVYVAEMFPRLKRGRYQSMLLAIGLLGVPIAAWSARWIIPTGPNAWRWIFVVGAGGILAAIAAARILPESVRWQEAHGLDAAAQATADRLDDEALALGPLPLPESEPPASHGTLRDLFRGNTAKVAVLVTVAFALQMVAFYGYNAYVPTLLASHGYSTSAMLNFTSFSSLAAAPGALLLWAVVDRVERKVLIFITCTTVAVLFVIFGLTSSSAVALTCGIVLTLVLQSSTAVYYTYLPEVFPTHLRGVGAGTANGVGRLAVFAIGFFTASLVSGLGFGGWHGLLAGLLFLSAVVVTVGPRTTSRPLVESVAPAAAPEFGPVADSLTSSHSAQQPGGEPVSE